MTDACAADPAGRNAEGGAAALGIGRWLYLAAAPTFAIMALLTAASGSPEMICAATSPLSGMVPMYLLMCVFHSPPWLKLIAGLGSDVRRG